MRTGDETTGRNPSGEIIKPDQTKTIGPNNSAPARGTPSNSAGEPKMTGANKPKKIVGLNKISATGRKKPKKDETVSGRPNEIKETQITGVGKPVRTNRDPTGEIIGPIGERAIMIAAMIVGTTGEDRTAMIGGMIGEAQTGMTAGMTIIAAMIDANGLTGDSRSVCGMNVGTATTGDKTGGNVNMITGRTGSAVNAVRPGSGITRDIGIVSAAIGSGFRMPGTTTVWFTTTGTAATTPIITQAVTEPRCFRTL